MKWHAQLSRYALVGIASNVFGYLLYLMLTYVGMGHIIAMSLLYILGVIQTFYLNHTWSFGSTGRASSAFLRYIAVYAIGYVLNLGLLWCAVDLLHLPHQAVQAMAVIVVSASVFLMLKLWVFAPTQGETV